MGPESDDAGETASVTSALARLKREGSNLLVVGATDGTVHATICDRLLGDSTGDRRRAFVTTEQGGCVPITPSSDTVIRYDSRTRSAAAASTPSADPTLPSDRVTSLSGLGSGIVDAIESIDKEVDGLDPAEFRLCIDSLGPLLEEYAERDLFRFLHAVTNEVQAVSGMAHYHLPVDYETDAVRTLAPLFDAVIEIRAGPDGPQQRWHLRRINATTEWLRL